MAEAPRLEAADAIRLVRDLSAANEEMSGKPERGTLDRRFRKILQDHFPDVHLLVLLPEPATGEAHAVFGSGSLRKIQGGVFKLSRITEKFGKAPRTAGPRVYENWKQLEPFRPQSPGVKAVAAIPALTHAHQTAQVWAEFTSRRYRSKAILELLGLVLTQYLALKRLVDLGAERDRLSARLNSIIENTTAAIVIIDSRRKVKMMNPVAEKLTGYRTSEVISTDAYDIVVVDARYARWTELFGAALAGKPFTSEEVDLLTKSGEIRRCLISGAAIPSETEGEQDIVLVAIDVTDKLNLERRMIQSEKLVTLGEMAAGIVHELNNPLSVLSGASDMLIRFVDNVGAGDVAARPAKFVRESVDRIQTLARNLMNFARPSDDSDFERIDVNQAIEAALSFSEYELSRDGIRIETQLASRLPKVKASPGELQQVFLNLLQNARQAMKGQETPRKIRVSTSVQDSAVLIEVADSGPGIPESLVPKIFEPFFTSRRKSGGSGLGLYIVRNIVQRHGGEIQTGRGPLGGASFTVRLPADRG